MALRLRQKEKPMNLSYKARRRLKNIAIGLGAALVVALLILLLWVLWLDRYVVYTREGARLDFSHSSQELSGQSVTNTKPQETVSIYFNEGENTLVSGGEMAQMDGYYITGDMLSSDFDGVLETLRKLPSGTAVLLDVKDVTGRFYYSTGLGPTRTSIDTTRMDALIKELCSGNLYAIARFPAFREYSFAVDNVNYGLASTKGAYLYMDEGRCYWLNPASSGTMNFVMQQLSQIKELGFDEVVLGDFRFPKSTEYRFTGDKTQTLISAAKALTDTFGSDYFTVSFEITDDAFTLPEARSRIYRTGCLAEEAKAVAEKSTVEDTSVRLVFITELLDTRFDPYSVLRPITSAHLE